ncbi:ADP-ribosylation factor-related protein 1 isoform X1 [Trichechus manatus latirostris]|uniref:ADP-ribosylation factor-related protein 1 isoform X1 n=1 Tax=Trichechus manatus latirostris TaxID=127582 RepID=A0A2Y9S1R3_TRIMA|nr:ADP-ribosylation factor-related protein 1 isoform X1 [Trichechus manatus latirostris]
MYTLLSGLYKYVFQKDEYCILILGLDNAGKTTFLEQSKTRFNKHYKGMSLSKITTTVGLNIGTVDVGKARLMFWDLGGQEELQSLWDKYYAECHGVIYVIDSTDEERLSESKQAFDLPLDPRHQDSLQRLYLQDRAAGLPDPGLFSTHGQGRERGHRVDGEVRRAQCPSTTTAEGYHIGVSTAGGQFVSSCCGRSLPGPGPVCFVFWLLYLLCVSSKTKFFVSTEM